MKVIRVICYYRVSTPKQLKREGIPLQRKIRDVDLAEYAKKEGVEIKIIAEFEDPGISGGEIKTRPGFKEALKLIQKGEADLLWVFNVLRRNRKLKSEEPPAEFALLRGYLRRTHT